MQTLGQMGNLFQIADVLSKESLRLLKNNLVFKDLVYRPFETEVNKGGIGKTITFKKPYRTKTASGKQFVQQPLTDETDTMTISHREHFGIKLTDDDLKYTLQQYSDRYLKSGMIQMANVIDKSIADAIKVGAFLATGTPGTAVALDTFTYASAAMDDLGIPNDGNRHCVMNSMDAAVVTALLSGKYNEQIVKDALRKGFLSDDLGDFKLYKSSNLTPFDCGTASSSTGTPLTNGANQRGNSLVTDGWTAGVVLPAGATIQIAGVYEINPQNYSKTSRNKLATFVVTADTTADSSGNMSIPVLPAINDGKLTTVDTEGNTVSLGAYQNVNASVADGAAITVHGAASTSYRQNLMFHKTACAFSMIDIDIPKSFNMKARASHEGFSLSIVSQADINDYTEKTRVDAEWGVKLVYPELAMRCWSASA